MLRCLNFFNCIGQTFRIDERQGDSEDDSDEDEDDEASEAAIQFLGFHISARILKQKGYIWFTLKNNVLS